MNYPNDAGYKDTTVSKTNAMSLIKGGRKSRQKTLRTIVLELYQTGFEGSADDVAARLDVSPFSIRPRVTELYKMKLLERKKIVSKGGVARWIMMATKKQGELPL